MTNTTTVDYPTTANIKSTMESLKGEFHANGQWQGYSQEKRDEILDAIANVCTNDDNPIRRIAAHDLLLELTGRITSTGM